MANRHGGLSASIHNTPAGSSGNASSHPPANGHGQGHGGLSSSIHNSSSAAASGHGTSSRMSTSSEGTSHNKTTSNSEKETQPRRTRTVAMGSFYILEPDFRDHLWVSMGLKMPKFSGCESWVLPFPPKLNFMRLVLFGSNDAVAYLDDRFVRIVFRTVYDNKSNTELSKELLLTPANPSIQLEDPRLHIAMADAWIKLTRWMVLAVQGKPVSLLEFLKQEVKNELKKKLESATVVKEVALADIVQHIDQFVEKNDV
ncbi:hypothetical protein PG987_012990 [Apiospora arundinis]